MIDGIAEFLATWPRARARTVRILDHLPAEALEWTWAEGRFTFGDLFRHLASIERFLYAENVADRPSRYPGHGSELASGLDGVRAYLARCHEEAMAIFSKLDDEALQRPRPTPAGKSARASAWLRAMAEHEAHHRGQLHLMASMRGIALPPLFGLTEEQLRAASQADGPLW